MYIEKERGKERCLLIIDYKIISIFCCDLHINFLFVTWSIYTRANWCRLYMLSTIKSYGKLWRSPFFVFFRLVFGFVFLLLIHIFIEILFRNWAHNIWRQTLAQYFIEWVIDNRFSFALSRCYCFIRSSSLYYLFIFFFHVKIATMRNVCSVHKFQRRYSRFSFFFVVRESLDGYTLATKSIENRFIVDITVVAVHFCASIFKRQFLC